MGVQLENNFHLSYAPNFRSLQPPQHLIWLWKNKLNSKNKVFGWLLLIDRLNTIYMLDHKHCAEWDCDLSYVLCHNQPLETLLHLLGILWNTYVNLENMLLDSRANYSWRCSMEKKFLERGIFGSKEMASSLIISLFLYLLGGNFLRETFSCCCCLDLMREIRM